MVSEVYFGEYNTRYSINYELKDKVDNPVNDDTVFIHYVGPTKPWHEWADYPVSRSFLLPKQLLRGVKKIYLNL
ncbi:glycosyltransferase [Escherichia coli]